MIALEQLLGARPFRFAQTRGLDKVRTPSTGPLKRVGAAGGTTEAADAAEAAVGIAAGGEAPTAGDAEATVDAPDTDGARRDG